MMKYTLGSGDYYDPQVSAADYVLGMIPYTEEIGDYAADELVYWAKDIEWNRCSDPDTFSILDSQIKENALAFVRQGICLARICRHTLYKFRKFKSFKEYCQRSLGKSLSYSLRLMQAAGLVLRLINLGFSRLPANESQCRPLVKVADDSELREKWQLILRIADGSTNKGIITAQMVADVMDCGTGKKVVRLNPKLHEKLQQIADDTGKSIEEVLEDALANYSYTPKWEEEPALIDEENVTVAAGEFGVDESTYPKLRPAAERIANWQSDLEQLIKEWDEVRGVPAADSS